MRYHGGTWLHLHVVVRGGCFRAAPSTNVQMMNKPMWCMRHQQDLNLCPRVWFWPCKPIPGPPILYDQVLPVEPEEHPIRDFVWTLATVVLAVWVIVGFLELIQ